jgi:hypothetical protein
MAQTTRIVQLLQLAVYDAHKCIPTPRSIPQLIQMTFQSESTTPRPKIDFCQTI